MRSSIELHRGQTVCLMRRPETKYVAIGDADVAYQVLGEGPSDLLFFNGLGSNVEMAWEDPVIADFLRRLASLRRLIFFDRRGKGASDGVPRNAIPTWEEWTEDVESVLNAVGSEQTSILATVDAGPIPILYAAAHPERVDSLVLCNTTARYLIADGYPIGFTPEALDFVVEFLRTRWGTPEFLSLASAAGSEDPVRRDAVARPFRSSVTPRTAAAQYDYLLRNLDVRPVLPLIRVPTLVLSADNPSFLPITHGRHVAEHIEGSKFVELPGHDMLIFSQQDLIFDEVAEFLTGTRPVTDIDRVLVCVLFTDIVGSTELAASLGDQRWRSWEAVQRPQPLEFTLKPGRDDLVHLFGQGEVPQPVLSEVLEDDTIGESLGHQSGGDTAAHHLTSVRDGHDAGSAVHCSAEIVPVTHVCLAGMKPDTNPNRFGHGPGFRLQAPLRLDSRHRRGHSTRKHRSHPVAHRREDRSPKFADGGLQEVVVSCHRRAHGHLVELPQAGGSFDVREEERHRP
jgi:pimeloyl-ACP methyl ester carboxylesterase